MERRLSGKTQRKVDAIERRKAMLDALLKFCLQRQFLTEESRLKPLREGKTGLQFGEYALIVPNWKGDRVALTLFRSGEDWINTFSEQELARIESIAAEDVSKMAGGQLQRLLDKMFHEANPDCEEKDE